MYTFPDQMNWQFVQILIHFKFQSKLRVLDTDDVKQKTSFFSVRDNLLAMFSWFFFVCFMCHLCLLHKINAQTPITAILSTCLIHEFLVNVNCRMDGSHRKPYICLSFDFLIQYSANFGEYAGICHLPLASLKRVTFNFPDRYGNSLTWLSGNDWFFWHGDTCHTLILWGGPKSRCSFRILNRIEERRPAIINVCYAWLKRHSCVYV